ncbi:baseplate J/gp47 family protein [Serratia quinivorans]|uniref:baseplate J/gp47 family protein n=1 Tax=Serratia quinivorans TaxID=137545 RepID=UPI002E7A864D|nr:baseplate J/gp47 family protein [Serratia quinivorans]
MSDLPIIVTQSGAQPTPPQVLLSKLIGNVAAEVPGYTANLPPGLITDLASTATGALALIDNAMVDLINSVTPYGANVPLLNQLGGIYGIQQGGGSNTAIFVVFKGSSGFVIPRGLMVSDGNYQYSVQHNSIVPNSGQSEPVYCVADTPGSWAVPVGSVTQIVTSIPQAITLTCTNTTAGIAGQDAQLEQDYRAQVMQAGMFAVQGTPDAVKTALAKVPGVQSNLIAYRQVSLGKWAVIVGGGDSYAVAQAIYEAVPDVSMLTKDVNDPSGKVPASVTVTINDYPDSYSVPYITPTSEMVEIILTWNTSAQNYVDPASISFVSVAPLANYVNAIAVGQPINIYQLQSVFQAAVASTINIAQLSLIKIEVAINGVVIPPQDKTGLIFGDSYSYFTTDASHVMVQQYDGSN